MHVIERSGSGAVAVCIHGFCQSSLFWASTLDRLAEAGIAGMAPDLPGFGESADLPGPWTLEAYADGLAALLDRKGIDRVSVVGGSMGGAVAQHFALRHPTRVARLLAGKLNVVAEITAVPYRTMREYSDRPGELGLLMGKGLADSQKDGR